uniref:Retrovirus-related Pol polyprotein from transposon TNT 1-94 n=1 Tax=Tanacetum cinerariifolium TaxID=118510 RepID=A0A6L2M8W7_TANCI|nr:retrovirus-related Pol polyprotein from transposon TNT 1-94 [Tanacetum cinerariifolium]
MSTQQDIYTAGSENLPSMLNKENYVPWSSRLLRYAKSRPNEKLIHNSIINGPYVRRMIPEPGDPNREIKANDQAIQTILLGIPEDIYAAVDSCETAQEIWLHVQQMMKGFDIGIQEKKAKLFNEWERFTSTNGESIESYYYSFLKLMNDLMRNKHFPEKIASNLKFLNNLQPEWSRHVTIVHQTKDLHTADYTQLYDFLKYNQKENPNGNDNLVAARAGDNATGHNDGSAKVQNYENCYDNEIFNMFTQEEQYSKLLKPILEPHQVPQNDKNVISEVTSVEQSGRTLEHHPVNVEETQFSDDTTPSVARKFLNEVKSTIVTLQRMVKHRMTLDTHNWSSSAHQELHKIVKDEFFPIANQVDARLQNFEIQFLKEAAKFVGHFKSLAKEDDESLVKHKKLENENVELEFRVLNYAKENAHLKTTYKNLFDSIYVIRTQTKTIIDSLQNRLQDTIYENAKLRAQLFDKVSDQKDTAYGTSANTKFAKQSILGKPPKVGVDNTPKTRRPQPRRNKKNNRVLSASKSSCSKNKEVEVEEHHRKLLLSRNKKHMSSKCNNIKLATQNVKSKVVCAMCKQCLKSINHDVCLLNYVNGMTSRGKKQTTNVSINKKQKKQQPKVKKTKKVGSIERLASPKPSKSRSFLRWSPTGRLFDLKGKIIASSKPESQSDCSKGDNACTSNPLEPTIKRFPNSTFSLAGYPNMFMQVLKEYFDSVGISHQVSSVKTPQQNRVVERRNRTLVEAARTMLIFSHAPLFLWAEAIATACFTQNRFIIHCRFNKTSYELINGRKLDISFLHVFRALCYPKNDHEDIGKLGAKGDIGFFIGYSANSCAYRVFNRRIKKIIETINVTFDELSAMDFEQRSSKPGLQRMTSGQISSGLDLTYAPSTITTQQPTEVHQLRQTPTTSTSIADTALTPTNSSSQPTNFPNTSQDVNGLKRQQHAQQQGNQAPIQPKIVADNVPNSMFDGNMFFNPFATPSISAAESSSLQYVDPSNIHTVYQPYPHEFQWTKDHPLEQVIREPSRPVLTRNQLRSNDMKTTFLHSSLKEDVYVCQPKGFIDADHPSHVFKLKKALYRLKQAPRAWYDELSMFLLQNHFFKGTTDPTLFIRRFIDDILVSNYVLKILKNYGMESCDPVGTPMEIKDKLDLDQNGALVDATKYHSMIGALMYLTSSRPDIVHATFLCARYQAKPTEKHLNEVKSIFRYLWGTVNTGLWYTKDSSFELTGFSDADYAGCKDTFKSTSGGA